MSAFKIMIIRVQRDTNVSKEITLLYDVDVGSPEFRVCGRCLKGSVRGGMNNISNVKVQLKPRRGNANI